jgi:transcriptional regulator with XRE-family HTH domain
MRREKPRLSHYFAMVLKRQRESKNLSRQGLAERAGLHQTAVGLIERGLRTPNLDTLNALAQALETEVSQLIREAEAEMPHTIRAANSNDPSAKVATRKRSKR